MKSKHILIKAEKREKLRLKEKNAPKGATLSGQYKRAETSMFYTKRKKITKTQNK